MPQLIVQIVSDISSGAYAPTNNPTKGHRYLELYAATCHDVQHQIWCLLELCIDTICLGSSARLPKK